MSYKIALATSDGNMVNEHFCGAKMFMIFRVKNNTAKFLEFRENKPSYENIEHMDEVLNKSVDLISDCKALYVNRIGAGPLKVLEDKKITVFEFSGYIADIIGNIIAQRHNAKENTHYKRNI